MSTLLFLVTPSSIHFKGAIQHLFNSGDDSCPLYDLLEYHDLFSRQEQEQHIVCKGTLYCRHLLTLALVFIDQ